MRGGGGGLLETTGRPASLLGSGEETPAQPGSAHSTPALSGPSLQFICCASIKIQLYYFGLQRSFQLGTEPNVICYKL